MNIFSASLWVGVATVVSVGDPSVAARAQQWRTAGMATFDAVWQIVHDTHYDPDFGGVDWTAVRAELRPRAEAAPAADDQRVVIREMLGRLGQSHFALLTSAPAAEDLRGPAGMPFDVRVTSAGLLVTRLHSPAAGLLQPGDRIVRVGDVTIAELMVDLDTVDARDTYLGWRRATRELSGEVGTVVALGVERPGSEARDVVVSRVSGTGELVKVGNLPAMQVRLESEEHHTTTGRRVGVIGFNLWMTAIAEPFAEAVDRFRDADGLIIDLRGNPGGLADMIRGIAGHLLDEPLVLGRMRMRGLELEFRANPRRSTSGGRRVIPFSGPVAVFVDGLTASASECFAGALQSLGRVHVFGTRSMGQALPASTQRLANGDVLLHAVGDFVTSTGQRIEGAGVVPDVEVPLDPAALASGRNALQAALDWIDTTPRLAQTETPR